MSSTIASLQHWVSDTIVDSFGLVYVIIGALVGVAHGSVHGVQTLAPRLTSVQGIKQLVSGEKAAQGGAVTGEPCPVRCLHHLVPTPVRAVVTSRPCRERHADPWALIGMILCHGRFHDRRTQGAVHQGERLRWCATALPWRLPLAAVAHA